MGNVGINIHPTDAETLNGKSASDFVPYHDYAPIYDGDILDIPEMGTYSCGVDTCTNLPAEIESICYVTMLQFRDSGYKRFICTALNYVYNHPNDIWQASESVKDSDGKLIWFKCNDNGNADTLDGLHANEIASNPNLLDNPDFKINQRGFTTTETNGVYCADRWRVYLAGTAGGNVTFSNDGISISSYGDSNGGVGVFQMIDCPTLANKTATLSVLFGDGRTLSVTGVIKNTSITWFVNKWSALDNISIFTGVRPVAENGDIYEVRVYVRSSTSMTEPITIKGVKLELGSVATPFCPPDPATELAKCQRYYQRIKGVNAIFANGFIGGTTTAYLILPIVPMRVKPSLSLNGNVYLWAPNHIGSTAYKSSAITIGTNAINTSTLPIEATISADTNSVGHGCSMQFRDADSYIELSAEL